MIKNIIFDLGGVMFDESTENVSKSLGEDASDLCKRIYGKSFKDCVLGNMSVNDYIETFKDDNEYDKIKYILDKNNLNIFYPLMKDNYDYICSLKKLGYNLYILSNITEVSYEHVMNSIDYNIFSGGVFSFKEKLLKPNKEIYELIVNRYNLNKEETIFFDDKQRNVDSANEYGIKSYLFRNIDDIKNNL